MKQKHGIINKTGRFTDRRTKVVRQLGIFILQPLAHTNWPEIDAGDMYSCQRITFKKASTTRNRSDMDCQRKNDKKEKGTYP